MRTSNREEQESSETPASPQVGTRFSAEEIHENVSKAAEEELKRPATELAWSALASGLVIGFSFLASSFLASLVPEFLQPAANALGYPLGFLYVVHGRHQLFTENTLEPVIPVLEKRNAETLGRLLRLWGIVLPLNLVGALLFALVVGHTEVMEPKFQSSMLAIARHATSGGALLVFSKAIWAGWLVALMAWLIGATRDTTAQILLVWLATAPIAAFGFKHSIAGAVEAFYRAGVGDASWWSMIGSFEIPAILGNVVGGVVLVALLNHGQVSRGSTEDDESADQLHESN